MNAKWSQSGMPDCATPAKEFEAIAGVPAMRSRLRRTRALLYRAERTLAFVRTVTRKGPAAEFSLGHGR